MAEIYRADASLKAKLRRRVVRLYRRRPARRRLHGPMVSFAFDDAPASATRAGAALLQARGLRGTYFICAGLLGRRGPVGPYATARDIQRLVDDGHEIACHTYSHLDCGRADGETIAQDLARNAEALTVFGARELATFAYPYGDVNPAAKRAVSQRFALSRALHKGLIGPGSDLNQAPAVGMDGDGGESTALRWLDRAKSRSAWLILFAHGVEEKPGEFAVSRDSFSRILDEALGGGFEVVTVAEGARRMGAAQ